MDTNTATRERRTRRGPGPERICDIRWPQDGSGYLEAQSSDGETWYEITLDRNRNLRCSCLGYLGHRSCYHLKNAAHALEDYLTEWTKGQAAFERASRQDPRRIEIREEKDALRLRIDEAFG